jgi:twitching motility protein PilT
MQTGTQHGMQTMDAALSDLVRRGAITRELALRRSSTPDDLKRLMGQPAMAGAPAGRGR